MVHPRVQTSFIQNDGRRLIWRVRMLFRKSEQSILVPAYWEGWGQVVTKS